MTISLLRLLFLNLLVIAMFRGFPNVHSSFDHFKPSVHYSQVSIVILIQFFRLSWFPVHMGLLYNQLFLLLLFHSSLSDKWKYHFSLYAFWLSQVYYNIFLQLVHIFEKTCIRWLSNNFDHYYSVTNWYKILDILCHSFLIKISIWYWPWLFPE